jgi:hypothetical protein
MYCQTILSFLSTAAAFKTSIYSVSTCIGMGTTYEKNVADGCEEAITNFDGVINKWTSEADNKQLLVTYSDKTCCHANMIQMIDWAEGCQKVNSEAGSWRIVSEDDWDLEKAGDSHTCGGTAII